MIKLLTDFLTQTFFLQLGEWIFVASGTGLLPQPQDPVSVYTEAGSNITLIIPFRNPMDHAVIVDVQLKGKPDKLIDLRYVVFLFFLFCKNHKPEHTCGVKR